MTFIPLHVIGQCVETDENLFSNMETAIARGLPEVLRQEPIREGVVALVGSGPSVKAQLSVIREAQKSGSPVVAIKDAHDWLIENGIVPDYGLAIDPQEHRAKVFDRRHPNVHYMLASQMHPETWDYMKYCKVTIWHPYVKKGQKRPGNRMLIGGGTTSGLRAISLFYVLGWRHFALFGFDSCCENGVLRVNGTLPKSGDAVSEIRIDRDGETFYCTPGMALQAEHFQTYYDWLPDAQFYAFGDGLIPAIIRQREKNQQELELIADVSRETNERVSFIHFANDDSASYRYRAATPARWLGASLNDLSADTLIFSKPQAHELMDMARAKARGAWVVADFCDDHFDWTHYGEALRLANVVTCPTKEMQRRIKELGRDAQVIPDGYEYDFCEPHVSGCNLLWFGHAVNKQSLARIMPEIEGYPLRVVSNFGGAIPWSKATMIREFALTDIVVMPFTEAYKSANRTLEAIIQGCMVVAEPHPAINDIPGIWIGNIREGIEWTRRNPQEANRRIGMAQKYVMDEYSPKTLTAAWRKAIERPITSDAVKSTGTDG